MSRALDDEQVWIKHKTARLREPHIAPLTEYVERLRVRCQQQGGIPYFKYFKPDNIPYFDPDDGGIHGRILLVKEAPGPTAIESGFVAPENKGLTASNLRELREKVPLSRCLVTNWNIVPWYVGNENRDKIAPPSNEDLRKGVEYLKELLELLPKLQVIILMGGKARKGWKNGFASGYKHPPGDRYLWILETWHPSPVALNLNSGRRTHIHRTFQCAQILAGASLAAEQGQWKEAAMLWSVGESLAVELRGELANPKVTRWESHRDPNIVTARSDLQEAFEAARNEVHQMSVKDVVDLACRHIHTVCPPG